MTHAEAEHTAWLKNMKLLQKYKIHVLIQIHNYKTLQDTKIKYHKVKKRQTAE